LQASVAQSVEQGTEKRHLMRVTGLSSLKKLVKGQILCLSKGLSFLNFDIIFKYGQLVFDFE